MAAVILATGLAFAAVLWAIGSMGRGRSGTHRMPPVQLPPDFVPPSAAVWTIKTKTTTTNPEQIDG